MTFNTRPVPVLDSVSEMRRHLLWKRVEALRAELQVEPSLELHHELGAALAELQLFDSRGGET